MYEALVRIDYRLVGWSWGMWDWNWFRPRKGKSIAGRLARRASPGDIIVMHDGHHGDPRADRRYAVEATRQHVPAMKAHGVAFGTLCASARDAPDPQVLTAATVPFFVPRTDPVSPWEFHPTS